MRSSSEHALILHGSKPNFYDVSPINVETTFFAKVCYFAVFWCYIFYRCFISLRCMLNNLNNIGDINLNNRVMKLNNRLIKCK